jgi:hypothetical protein
LTIGRHQVVIIKDQRDFVAGIMFAAIGVAFAVGATRYSVGTSGRMGPGYFPLILGLVLAGLGSVVMIKALISRSDAEDAPGPWPWKPIFFILGANILFGILIGGLPSIGLPPMGLIAAIVVVTFVASAAGQEFSWGKVALLALALAAGSYLVFILLLRLVLPIWPEWD